MEEDQLYTYIYMVKIEMETTLERLLEYRSAVVDKDSDIAKKRAKAIDQANFLHSKILDILLGKIPNSSPIEKQSP